MICVEHLKKGFSNNAIYKEVIKDVSLKIEDGTFVFIMGPSGSGKTTLLNSISGINKPDGGKVLIDGVDITNANNKQISDIRKSKIGFVFQDNRLIDELTVYENVYLSTRIAKNNNSVENILKLVGMTEFKDYKAKNLSGGMAQKVNVARAIVNRPSVLFADEPTGSLDSKSGKEIMELLRKINIEERITIIMVTHQKEYTLYGNRVISIMDGNIVSDEKI